jgi:hypothetical protein
LHSPFSPVWPPPACIRERASRRVGNGTVGSLARSPSGWLGRATTCGHRTRRLRSPRHSREHSHIYSTADERSVEVRLRHLTAGSRAGSGECVDSRPAARRCGDPRARVRPELAPRPLRACCRLRTASPAGDRIRRTPASNLKEHRQRLLSSRHRL